MRRRRIIAATCALGLAIAACGGDNGSDTAADSGVPVATEAPATEAVGVDDGEPLPENVWTEADDPEATATAAPDTLAGAPVDDAVVPALLQFSAPLVGGGEIDAANLAGKPTVFWFWAPT